MRWPRLWRRVPPVYDGRWSVCTRLDIPDLVEPDKTYLTRFRLIETPYFAIYLHKINLPDRGRHLHSHPWAFWSLVLRGGYYESYSPSYPYNYCHDLPTLVVDGRLHKAGRWHKMGLRAFHSVVELFRSPTWTLLLVGKRRQDWGFATAKGLVSHEVYSTTTEPLTAAEVEYVKARRGAG